MVNDMSKQTIDISEINCWIAYLKPNGIENLLELQEKCIQENIYGIGWPISNFKKSKVKMTVDLKMEYELKCNEVYNGISKTAINNIGRVCVGDLIIIRNKNGHYYIGKVDDEAFYDPNLLVPELSWCISVECWFEYKFELDLPMGICGRFSQQRHSTIERVADKDLKTLIVMAYNNVAQECIGSVDKIKLTEENFAKSLDYRELENLVCKYIYDKHKAEDYILLPSTAKISHPKYEFTFVSDKFEPITCQVKNQKEIDVALYKDDYNVYRKIYLFSGIGKYPNNNNKLDNIVIIEPEELYKILKNFEYIKKKLEEYYVIK